MATIRAFKAFRPDSKYVDRIAALPYDVISTEEARKIVKNNPYSFLRVDKAEINFESIDIYDHKVYDKAREKLYQMIELQHLIQDDKLYLYLYRLTKDGRSQTGIVCCCAIDDYLSRNIKDHELTREDKEQDRIQHVDVCNANTGPIFLTYRSVSEIDRIVDDWVLSNESIYDFIADDGVGHQVWVVDNEDVINKLQGLFTSVQSLYIADGHHRAAAAVKVGLKRRQENKEYTGKEEFNHFLSVVFPDNQLEIIDYNRIVRDLNGLNVTDFIDKVKLKFDILEVDYQYRPQNKHSYGMYLDSKWYHMQVKPGVVDGDLINSLDVSILQNHVLDSILGIKDPRTDTRIEFIGGVRGLNLLEDKVNKGVGFVLYPPSIEEMIKIADINKSMPPKSTWFEPKLRSGIFIHLL